MATPAGQFQLFNFVRRPESEGDQLVGLPAGFLSSGTTSTDSLVVDASNIPRNASTRICRKEQTIDTIHRNRLTQPAYVVGPGLALLCFTHSLPEAHRLRLARMHHSQFLPRLVGDRYRARQARHANLLFRLIRRPTTDSPSSDAFLMLLSQRYSLPARCNFSNNFGRVRLFAQNSAARCHVC